MKKRARRLYDGNPSAVVAQRGDIVYTADVIDLQRLQTFFPAVTCSPSDDGDSRIGCLVPEVPLSIVMQPAQL